MNQREIKFRMWNGSKMLQDNEVAFVPPIVSTLPQTFREGLNLLLGKYAVMQFTGFKDKNGVEIYEGDILKWTPKPEDLDEEERENPPTELSLIVWESGSWCRENKAEYRDLLNDSTDIVEVFDDEEVIGNIYENPKLLK